MDYGERTEHAIALSIALVFIAFLLFASWQAYNDFNLRLAQARGAMQAVYSER